MSRSIHRLRLCAGAAAALALLHAAAQAQPAPVIVITGNALGRDALAQPTSVLSGDDLLRKRAATLGETLDGLPGVSSTWYGPNSARPIIRGLDGDRVRMLDNGAGTVDASSLSFDHAVAIDPLVVERLEVLRGAAALLYGGSAIGGVVNAIDNRIPRAPLGQASGRVEVRLGGAAAERAAAAVIEGGAAQWAWHADADSRSNGDQRAPLLGHVRNSAATGEGGALGGAWADENGYAGLSLDSYRSAYGVTVEPDVTIKMQRERAAFALERRKLPGWFTQIEVHASQTRYRHDEVEGSGAIGTTFKSTGSELRLQARHAPLGPLTGALGLQSNALDFSALGEEAFVPSTRTRTDALFFVEEFHSGAMTWTAGWRQERTRVASAGDEDASAPRFGIANARNFAPRSLSLGGTWSLGSGLALSATAGSTERAPAYYELYANGLHVATAAYERGDPLLGTEKSHHADVGLEWKQDAASIKAHVFKTHFSRFISLDASGQFIANPDAASIPVYEFRAVRARLQGLEIDGRWRLAERLEITGGLDAVRGMNLDSNEPLPRLAPLRIRIGVEGWQGAWRFGVAARHSAAQIRVPATDSITPGHSVFSAWASWQSTLLQADALWFLRLDNIGNQLAYNASTINTLRALVPLPGRSITGGVRLRF